MKTILSLRPSVFGMGLLAGLAIAYVDNCTFNGEVSPIIIIGLLLAATMIAGVSFGRSGWLAAAATWVCLPLAHLFKHVLGWPDTLHPNTYVSIMYLAAFTLIVAACGMGCGLTLRKFR